MQSGSVLPLGDHADDTAQGSGETDDAVVEGEPAQAGAGNADIAEITEELLSAGGALAVKMLSVRKRELYADMLIRRIA